MSAPGLAIEIQRVEESVGVPSDADLRGWIELACGAEASGELTLRIVGEAESADLNARYRGKSGATNVLAFRADDLGGGPGDEPLPFGDLVVCAPVVAREAAEQGKAPAAHWAHIVIHGTLHLVGHDHAAAAEADIMERRERELLARLGVADPYRARAG